MRCAIYLRISTSDGRQDTENQRLQLTEYAASQNWNVVATFEDHQSGKNQDRPAFQKMMQAASQHRFDVLLFWSLDRLSREGVLPTLHLLQQLTAQHIGYKSFTEQYLDSCGIFRDAVLAILATIAKQERVRLSERTKAGLARVIAQRIPGPKGYIGPGRPSLPQPDLVELRQWREEGVSFQRIAARLGFSKSWVRNILQRAEEEEKNKR